MSYGLNAFIATQAGLEAQRVIASRRADLVAAAVAGEPPINVIAEPLSAILGSRHINSMVGRLIADQLRPAFKPCGVRRWARRHGTESGAVYCRR